MNTLFDTIWDKHVVQIIKDGPTQLYIDRLYCHEVTSPQAFSGLRERGLKCFRPKQIFCMPDHNTPTHDQDKPIEDPVSRKQVETLKANAEDFGLTYYGMMDKDNGIIHVVGPEKGLSLPGMTIVCGDSHTSTHGATEAKVNAHKHKRQTCQRCDRKRCGSLPDVRAYNIRCNGVFR